MLLFSPATIVFACLAFLSGLVYCSLVGLGLFGLLLLALTMSSSLRVRQGARGAAGLGAPMPVDMQPHQGLYHYETSPSQPPRG